MTKQGLDAAGHLLLAKGHLMKARDALATKDMSPLGSDAIYWASEAADHTRLALVALEREKEEPCKP